MLPWLLLFTLVVCCCRSRKSFYCSYPNCTALRVKEAHAMAAAVVAAVAVRAAVRLSVRQFRAMNRQKGARLKGTDSIEEI